MVATSENSPTDESVIVENNEGMIADSNRAINQNKSDVIIPKNNEVVLIERGIKGTVVTINRLKHFTFIKRKDKIAARDVFAREASIINEGNQKKFFVADVCRFDIMKTAHGFEAINIDILERNINSIRKLPKIPKKPETNPQQTQISGDLFKSTITELFREALKKK